MNTDPIADMLTRIRNANMVGHATLAMPSSKMKEGIAKILVNEGFVDDFKVEPAKQGNTLTISLRYGADSEKAILGIRRVSSPGRRVFRKAHELPRVQGGIGVAVVSTSQGLLPDREARRRKLGGELICEVW
jgi:small subunit ribosomal protein S8